MGLLDTLFDTEVNHKSWFHDRDNCYECEGNHLGFMVVFPIVLILAFLFYGFCMSYKDTDAPPKRVFIQDLDSSVDPMAPSKAKPVHPKTAVKKTHPVAHGKPTKSHHQEARHAK